MIATLSAWQSRAALSTIARRTAGASVGSEAMARRTDAVAACSWRNASTTWWASASSRRRRVSSSLSTVERPAGWPAPSGLDMSGLRSSERQPYRKGGALAVDALDGQVAAHQAAEVAADREAEASPAVLTPSTRFRLGERLEETAELLLRHPDTGVGDREGDLTPQPPLLRGAGE